MTPWFAAGGPPELLIWNLRRGEFKGNFVSEIGTGSGGERGVNVAVGVALSVVVMGTLICGAAWPAVEAGAQDTAPAQSPAAGQNSPSPAADAKPETGAQQPEKQSGEQDPADAQKLNKKQGQMLEHESGFLGGNYARLQPDKKSGDWLIYVRDGAVLRDSDKFMIEPVEVFLVPEAEKREIPQTDLDKLSAYFSKALRDELIRGHYDVVEQAGPGVKSLRFAITNVEPTGNKTNMAVNGGVAVAAHAAVPVPGAGMLVPRLKVGRVSIEGEMVDSNSKQVDVALMTSKSGRRFFSGLKAYQKWGDIDAAFRSWAKNFRERLDKGHES